MGKRNVTVNGVPKDIPHDLAAGSLKEIMGADLVEDWVFAKPLDGRHYHIPDDDFLPHDVSDFLIVPKWEFGAA
jgi:hypothetical protein